MSTGSELRRQVGRTLERLREEAGIPVTDREAGQIAGSTRTLKRLEQGVLTRLTFANIGRLCDYYHAPAEVKYELERIYRLADDKIWAQPSHAVANSGWDSYLEFERIAVGLDKFESMVPPGLAQTESFMWRLFERGGEAREEIPRLIEERLRRQAEFEQRLDRVRWRVLLTEAVLRNGCDDEQLERLLKLDSHRNVTIKYLPFAGGPYPMLDVPFSVLSFRNHEDPSIVYLESPYERRFYENSDAVGQYNRLFEGGILQAESLKEFHR